MPKFGPDKIRNVAILGHSHDGKTTLAEAILHATGTVARMGSTDAGTSTLDFEPEEVRRRISIGLGVGSVEHNGYKLNLVDAPGFFDFAGQVVSALRSVEGALVVVSANAGLAVGTEIAWDQCNRDRKPRLVVVNKMDKENADFFGTVTALRAALKPKPVPIQVPIGSEASFKGVVDLLHMKALVTGGDGKGQEVPIPDDLKARVEEYRNQMMEAAAEGDDELLEKYLEEGELNEEEMQKGLREGIVAGTVAPVVCCSAAKLLGVRTVLNAVIDLFPAPEAAPDGPAKAFVFNTTADPFVGRVTYFKVLSGCIKGDQQLHNVTRNVAERVGGLFFPRGKEHLNTPEVCAGDIGAVAKLQQTLTGDTVGDRSAQPEPEIELPRPVYALAIFPKARGDEEKIGSGLARLAEEDPTLHVDRTEETHELVISGLGDVHLDVILEKLGRKYGVQATSQVPKVAYRETIAGTAKVEGRHVKQSGGHGQYAVCTIEVAPTARGEGFVWEDKIFGGSIPQNFRPSVEKGVVDTMAKGAVAGYPMVDVRVALIDGKYHTVDSSDMAFQLAGGMAMRKAAMDASPVILEPVMDVEVTVPERFLGDIMSDLNGRRGKIAGTEPGDGTQTVRAQVPESELLKFALDLRSITQGRGTFSKSFSHHEEMPQHLAKALIEAYQKARADHE
ncbi:MAG: elongation factor G [Chloroflexi bacterium]|nr:MAG: elongation factor G [Chloroflexota bacterium]